jgi:putative colanic acid biosynthesis acetyltransferase WcaF
MDMPTRPQQSGKFLAYVKKRPLRDGESPLNQATATDVEVRPTTPYLIQDLSQFSVPEGFRGRSRMNVQLWWFVQRFLFHNSPQVANGFRRWLLRRFGARVGKNVIIRPSVNITYPWKISIGDYAWIGDAVTLYSLCEIEIGSNAVVSQHSYLCAGDHDYTLAHFPIRGKRIVIEEQAWIASDVFISPGVRIGKGAVIGARSAVFKDMPAGMVCMGHPAKAIKPREDKTKRPD